jgi:hypothetical protein
MALKLVVGDRNAVGVSMIMTGVKRLMINPAARRIEHGVA